MVSERDGVTRTSAGGRAAGFGGSGLLQPASVTSAANAPRQASMRVAPGMDDTGVRGMM
jgi:hypothetical protein